MLLVLHARLAMPPKNPKMSPVTLVVLPIARHVHALHKGFSHVMPVNLDILRNLQQSVSSVPALAMVVHTAAVSSALIVRITHIQLPPTLAVYVNFALQTMHHVLLANSVEAMSTAKHANCQLILTQLLRHVIPMLIPTENAKQRLQIPVPALNVLKVTNLRMMPLAEHVRIQQTAKHVTQLRLNGARTARMDMFMMIIVTEAPANHAAVPLGVLPLSMELLTVTNVPTHQQLLLYAILAKLDTLKNLITLRVLQMWIH
jgi:hypothetical protein